MDTPCYAHLVPIDAEVFFAIGQIEGDLSEPDRFTCLASVENNVSHLLAAERFGRLFAQHPAHGVEHVRFAATVRPDNGGNSFVKIKNRFISERFETE